MLNELNLLVFFMILHFPSINFITPGSGIFLCILEIKFLTMQTPGAPILTKPKFDQKF